MSERWLFQSSSNLSVNFVRRSVFWNCFSALRRSSFDSLWMSVSLGCGVICFLRHLDHISGGRDSPFAYYDVRLGYVGIGYCFSLINLRGIVGCCRVMGCEGIVYWIRIHGGPGIAGCGLLWMRSFLTSKIFSSVFCLRRGACKSLLIVWILFRVLARELLMFFFGPSGGGREILNWFVGPVLELGGWIAVVHVVYVQEVVARIFVNNWQNQLILCDLMVLWWNLWWLLKLFLGFKGFLSVLLYSWVYGGELCHLPTGDMCWRCG